MGAVMLDDRLFSLWPFGSEAVGRRQLRGRGDLGTSPLGALGNVSGSLWPSGDWPWATSEAPWPVFVTIVGIPFGIQHIKLALIALPPVGMTVVKSRN